MEIKTRIARSKRPCNLGHMFLCGLGVFSIVGQLAQGRHHDLTNTQTTHQIFSPRLTQQSSSSYSSVTNDDGKWPVVECREDAPAGDIFSVSAITTTTEPLHILIFFTVLRSVFMQYDNEIIYSLF
jgi:hypothetical protein